MEGDQPFFFLISSALGERKKSRALVLVGVPFNSSPGEELWLEKVDMFTALSTELSVLNAGATLLTDLKPKSEESLTGKLWVRWVLTLSFRARL